MIKQEQLIEFSIVICTRNRAEKITRILDSLTVAIGIAGDAGVEVVLVDNGSTDHTQNILRGWAGKSNFQVHCVFEKFAGLSIARNTGLAKALGKTIIFTDDDCSMRPDYLLVLRRYLAEDSQPVLRGGKVELGDATDIPFTILLGGERKRLQHPILPFGFLIGANMVIPRSVVDRVGLFDEHFGAGTLLRAGEESDYIYRAFKKGIPVEYVPDLVVQHFHGRKNKSAIAKLSFDYSVSGGALHTKYVFDRDILRHFYWDLKNCVIGISKGDMIFNKEFDVTCLRFMRASFTGVALYIWVLAVSRLLGRRSNRKKTLLTNKPVWDNIQCS